MIIEVKFKGEDVATILCESYENKGSFYVIKKAFIDGVIYDNIIAEDIKIEWIKQAGV